MFDSCFLFLDNPNGGVEDISYLKSKAPWVKGVFCNVHSYEPTQWESIVRPRCLANGLFCGPWGRTNKGTDQKPVFSPEIVDKIVATADKWQSPGIINSEKEVNANQEAINYIGQKVGNRNFAFSMEPWLFDSVSWQPVSKLPMLLQIMHREQRNSFPIGTDYREIEQRCKDRAHTFGFECVFYTYGTSNHVGYLPSDFDLKEGYSLFTGDPIMATYTVEKWAPTSTGFPGCKKGGVMPPNPDPVPAGAYDDVARLQTENIKRPDGKDATGFNSQRDSLKATRTAVNDHEKRIAAIEKKLGL